MLKIPVTAWGVRCQTGLDGFGPSHPKANFWQAPCCIFRSEVALGVWPRSTHTMSMCSAELEPGSFWDALALFGKTRINNRFFAIPQSFSPLSGKYNSGTYDTNDIDLWYLWTWLLLQLSPLSPPQHVVLLSWMYKTHVASETQQFQESRPITLWCDGTACCVRQKREEVLPMEALYHLGAAPVLWLAGDQHSSRHPFSLSQGGSDLCLALVALQGLSQPGQLVLPLSPGHLPWIPPHAWFGAVKQGLLCLCLSVSWSPS